VYTIDFDKSIRETGDFVKKITENSHNGYKGYFARL